MATTSTQPAPKPSAQTKKAVTSSAKQAPDPVAELARIEKEIKDLHANVVIPMRQKRASLRKERTEIKKKIREASAESRKSDRTAKKEERLKAKSEKKAAKQAPKEPTESEKQWAERRSTTGNGRRAAAINVTLAHA